MNKTVNGQTTVLAYDAFGNLEAEYGPAESSPCGSPTCYVTVDHLGSTRMLTDNTGSANVRRYDYLPFGGRASGRASMAGPRAWGGIWLLRTIRNPKFTGKNRDFDTGLDWFEVRYLSGAQGRFLRSGPSERWSESGGSADVERVRVRQQQSIVVHGSVWRGPVWVDFWDHRQFLRRTVGISTWSGGGKRSGRSDLGPDSTRFSTAPDIAGSLTGCGGPLGAAEHWGVALGARARVLATFRTQGDSYSGFSLARTHDALSPYAQAFYNEMSKRRQASNQMIGAFAARRLAVGVAAGAGPTDCHRCHR